MDEIHETMQTFNDIVNVMSTPISNDTIDEDELLSEFLEEENEGNKNIDILIPNNILPRKEKNEEDNLEDELEKLKMEMN